MGNDSAERVDEPRPVLDETRRNLAEAQRRLEALLEVSRIAREARARRLARGSDTPE